MKKNHIAFIFLFLLFYYQSLSAQETKSLQSPDGKLSVTFQLSKDGLMSYSLNAFKQAVISDSPMGFAAGNTVSVPSFGWKLESSEQKSIVSVWKPVWGKRSVVPDLYNKLVLKLKGPDSATLRYLQIEARAYNDGVAFRYNIPSEEKNSLTITGELTGYQFAGDYTAWYYNGENRNIGPEKLSESEGKRLPVMTIKASDNLFLALHEADLATGYPLVLQTRKGSTAFSVVSAPGKLEAGYQSAWRVILFGKTPGNLVDSHLIELLNPPAKGDFSWVKPGIAVWDWRINGAVADGFKYEMSLPSWKRMVDFASRNTILYLVLDADWYGPEFGKDSDPLKGGKVEQVHEIIKYGKDKGVGIWLYLNDVGGRNFPLEQTLKQYSDWGAAGIKYGFMSGNAEEKNLRTRMITALCAKYHLLCDYHDGPVHPYGQMRTFPNAITREYCHSQLDAHRVYQPITFVTSVFVNMLAGPIDMCNGLADLMQTGRVDEPSPVPSTLAGEAARTLIVFSGATIIPDIPENYNKHPEILQFIAAQKMPWQESKTLSGEIGKYIVMARQASDGNWLIGAATNEDARELDVPLSFLGNDNYQALIIQDGDDSDYRTHRESYKVQKQNYESTETIKLKLAPGGGACVFLKKLKL
jgi:alpha-glucosidase